MPAEVVDINLIRNRICACGRFIEVESFHECLACDHVRGEVESDRQAELEESGSLDDDY